MIIQNDVPSIGGNFNMAMIKNMGMVKIVRMC